ncbi:MAG: T9SS type A sorting domain-containing protein, partial [Bacteroidia bacterium]
MIKKITKILFLTVFGYLAVDTNAQSKINSNDNKYPAVASQDPITTRVRANLFKKAQYCGWFFPTDAVAATGPTLTSYVSFLTTDSTARFISDVGVASFNNWHVAGVCFDPKDENFTFVTDGVALSKFNNYKVDSIYFLYQYVRKLDSAMVSGKKMKVVDTLIFQFHNPNNMKYGTFATPAEKYGDAKNFNRNIGGATGATYTEKIPLTNEDSTTVTSTGWRSKGMLVAIPASVTAVNGADDNNQVGFNIFFKQMVPNNFGDTMEARNGASIKNPVNYAGYSLRINENTSSQVNQDVYRNNAYFTTSKQLYGGSPNGWQYYTPGNAYFAARYVYSAFHLCTPNLKATDVNKNGYGVGKISPNPSQAGQDVNVEFNIGNSEKVTLTVSDILGKTIKTVNTDKLNAGFNVISFNTATLTPGVYFYTITA